MIRVEYRPRMAFQCVACKREDEYWLDDIAERPFLPAEIHGNTMVATTFILQRVEVEVDSERAVRART